MNPPPLLPPALPPSFREPIGQLLDTMFSSPTPPRISGNVEWSTTSKESVSHGVKFLVYGNAGSGKTLLAATAPRPILISAENGILSLSRKNIERVYGVNAPGISYDIPTAKIKTVQGLTDIFDWLVSPANRGKFSTICLDSLSEMAEIILKNALRDNKDGRMAYGDLADQMIDMMKKFRDLEGYNVYFSAKQGLCEDSNLIGPSFPGKLLDREAPFLFDEIFQMQVLTNSDGQPVRVLRTSADGQHNAKDRSGALDPRGEFPNISSIIAKISA